MMAHGKTLLWRTLALTALLPVPTPGLTLKLSTLEITIEVQGNDPMRKHNEWNFFFYTDSKV
jgi:hypothetical protein